MSIMMWGKDLISFFSDTDTQLSQHHLVKRLSFPIALNFHFTIHPNWWAFPRLYISIGLFLIIVPRSQCLTRNHWDQKERTQCFSSVERKTCPPRILHPMQYPSAVKRTSGQSQMKENENNVSCQETYSKIMAKGSSLKRKEKNKTKNMGTPARER